MIQQEKLHLIGDIEGNTLFDGTNDVEIETNLTKFKYMEYTTKISANTVSTIKSEDLPEGFKPSNCIIVSCMYCISTPGVTGEATKEYKIVDSNENISVSLSNFDNRLKIETNLETSKFIRTVHFKTLFYKYL